MKIDQPILSTKQDLLERVDFALALANGITQYPENSAALTIGLNAEWGTGKSSTFNLIKENLQKSDAAEQHNLIITEFNPWHSQSNEYLKDFYLHIATAFKLYSERREKFKKVLSGLINSVDTVINKSLLGSLAGAEGSIKAVLKFLNANISTQIDDEKIRSLRDKIDKELSENNLRLVVFIDDLDRMFPEQIISIFKLLNHAVNFKNSIFLLAFDKKVVIEALDTIFFEKGEAYLEKIIHLDYNLPQANEATIKALFVQMIGEVLSKNGCPEEEETLASLWSRARLHLSIRNMRHLNRLINAIQLRYLPIQSKLALSDFVALELLQMIDFEAYSLVKNKYNQVSHYLVPEYKNTYAKELKVLGPNRHLVDFLFNSKRSGNVDQAFRNPYHYYLYFSHTKLKENLLETQFEEIIGTGQLRSPFHVAHSYNKLDSLRDLLIEHNYELNEDLAETILKETLDFLEPRTSIFLSSPKWLTLISTIIQQSNAPRSTYRTLEAKITARNAVTHLNNILIFKSILEKELPLSFELSEAELAGLKQKYQDAYSRNDGKLEASWEKIIKHPNVGIHMLIDYSIFQPLRASDELSVLLIKKSGMESRQLTRIMEFADFVLHQKDHPKLPYVLSSNQFDLSAFEKNMGSFSYLSKAEQEKIQQLFEAIREIQAKKVEDLSTHSSYYVALPGQRH